MCIIAMLFVDYTLHMFNIPNTTSRYYTGIICRIYYLIRL